MGGIGKDPEVGCDNTLGGGEPYRFKLRMDTLACQFICDSLAPTAFKTVAVQPVETQSNDRYRQGQSDSCRGLEMINPA